MMFKENPGKNVNKTVKNEWMIWPGCFQSGEQIGYGLLFTACVIHREVTVP